MVLICLGMNCIKAEVAFINFDRLVFLSLGGNDKHSHLHNDSSNEYLDCDCMYILSDYVDLKYVYAVK